MGAAARAGATGTLYEVLGLRPGASADEVRRAFHRFALRYHPDRYPGLAGEQRERLEAFYRRGTEAYRVLSDPAARRAYDRQLGLAPPGAGASPGPGQPGERRPQRASGRLQVRHPKARPFARKAQKALQAEQWQTAILNLKLALQHEPDNELLQARLEYAEERLGGGG